MDLAPVDLKQVDLNLLVTLDALLDEQHVTRAAARLLRTQSAVSHALGRLRALFDDPLLVRVGGRMEPSARARQLAPEVKRALQILRRLLERDHGWDPARSTRSFTLVAPDFVVAALPALIAAMVAEAPGTRVALQSPRRGMLTDVALGRYDLAVAPADAGPVDGLAATPLADLSWMVFARAGHPAAADWGLDAWLRYPHVRIRTTADGPGPVDRAIAAAGRSRRFGAALPHFLLGPPLVARTDMLLTVPVGALAEAAERYALVALPCPVELPGIRLGLFASALASGDPALAWFRRIVERVMVTTFGE